MGDYIFFLFFLMKDSKVFYVISTLVVFPLMVLGNNQSRPQCYYYKFSYWQCNSHTTINQITYIYSYITCDEPNVNDESILFEIDSNNISHVFGVASIPCLFKRSC